MTKTIKANNKYIKITRLMLFFFGFLAGFLSMATVLSVWEGSIILAVRMTISLSCALALALVLVLSARPILELTQYILGVLARKIEREGTLWILGFFLGLCFGAMLIYLTYFLLSLITPNFGVQILVTVALGIVEVTLCILGVMNSFSSQNKGSVEEVFSPTEYFIMPRALLDSRVVRLVLDGWICGVIKIGDDSLHSLIDTGADLSLAKANFDTLIASGKVKLVTLDATKLSKYKLITDKNTDDLTGFSVLSLDNL